MSSLPSLAEIEAVAPEIEEIVPETATYSWPILNERLGASLWVRHENHTAIASFKIRGAVAYLSRLSKREPGTRGVIAATRGNFGQAIAFAARRFGLSATIVVPHGNSREKNRAMRALGATLIEHGDDFQAALVRSKALAGDLGLHWVPSFHPDLVLGNAVSALAFLRRAPALDSVYVPIGLGSGICAMMAARDALHLPTRVIGVAADRSPAIALSFEARKLTTHPAESRIADGLGNSRPNEEALELILKGVERVVRVGDDEIEEAIRLYFSATHNVAEGAAGAGLAAVLKDRGSLAGRGVGVVLTGGNIDAEVYRRLLGGGSAPSA